MTVGAVEPVLRCSRVVRCSRAISGLINGSVDVGIMLTRGSVVSNQGTGTTVAIGTSDGRRRVAEIGCGATVAAIGTGAAGRGVDHTLVTTGIGGAVDVASAGNRGRGAVGMTVGAAVRHVAAVIDMHHVGTGTRGTGMADGAIL